MKTAVKHDADLVVATFSDQIGHDAIIEWPGGVYIELYSHTVTPDYPPLATVPDSRIYVSPGKVKSFLKAFIPFSNGRVVSDDPRAPGIEIGRPNETYRRIRVESSFGNMMLLVTDGHLPYPYGRETTGYEVGSLTDTLAKAKNAGATVLVAPYTADKRIAALVQFPGGYIAEIHAAAP
ncbi:MAG TPA: hypothetical protein VMT54_15900 [Candidatus Cybelea sp.]|nr:hypothetical protein [Candidatus Cybelea sp.]